MIDTPVCFLRNCKYLIGVDQPDGTEETERVVCKAFPNGIPDDIFTGIDLHTKPYPGDHGIQYARDLSTAEFLKSPVKVEGVIVIGYDPDEMDAVIVHKDQRGLLSDFQEIGYEGSKDLFPKDVIKSIHRELEKAMSKPLKWKYDE